MNVTHMDVTLSFAVVLDGDAPNALTPADLVGLLQAAFTPTVKAWRVGLANPALVSDLTVGVTVAPPAVAPAPPPAPEPAPVADPVPVDPAAVDTTRAI